MPQPTSKHVTSYIAGAILLCLLAWQGHQIAHRLPQLERGVAELGAWGPVAYVAAVLLLAPLLVPDSIFGVGAGVVFGLAQGFAWYFGATYVACLLGYAIGRRWLRGPVLKALGSRPALRDMAAVASRQGARLTFFIRLVPINPMVTSYALGAVGVSFRAVALGTFGMSPHMFLTVYLGVAAVHVTRMAGKHHRAWTLEGAGLMLGLVACAGLVYWMAVLARREIRAAERADLGAGPPVA